MKGERVFIWPGWESVRVIGIGSFGQVYEIRRAIGDSTESAAMKVISVPANPAEIDELRSEGYDDQSILDHYEKYRDEIVREYSIMLAMKGYANVVTCEDIRCERQDNGIGWDIQIKMELLTPLKRAWDGKYNEAAVIKLAKDMCRALCSCRRENVIHRDIKPQNIFLSRGGNFKLGDFGVAKISDKTASGTKIGTYDYMSPEVYNGQAYGTQADLYSLGLVLYWMMNERRVPFLPLPPEIPTSTQKDSARKRRFGGERLPQPVNGSAQLIHIVMKACAFDPADRYEGPEQMLQALENIHRETEELPEAQKLIPLTEPHQVCIHCGAALPPDSRFCTNCGGLVRDPAEDTLQNTGGSTTTGSWETGTVTGRRPPETAIKRRSRAPVPMTTRRRIRMVVGLAVELVLMVLLMGWILFPFIVQGNLVIAANSDGWRDTLEGVNGFLCGLMGASSDELGNVYTAQGVVLRPRGAELSQGIGWMMALAAGAICLLWLARLILKGVRCFRKTEKPGSPAWLILTVPLCAAIYMLAVKWVLLPALLSCCAGFDAVDGLLVILEDNLSRLLKAQVHGLSVYLENGMKIIGTDDPVRLVARAVATAVGMMTPIVMCFDKLFSKKR